jgi:hypothetical protein
MTEIAKLDSATVAARNDALRARIPSIPPPDLLVITRGINALGDEVLDILQKVREFSTFTPDNDPWGEHDFGSFEHEGKKIFWKIDDYNGQEGYRLVLTVMLADEY